MDSTETMELVENRESMENVEFVDKSAGVMQVCRGMVRVSCREVGKRVVEGDSGKWARVYDPK